MGLESNNTKIINRYDQLGEVCNDLSKYDAIGFDTETTDLDPYMGRVRLMQLSSGDATYVLDLDNVGDISNSPLKSLLENKNQVAIGQNLKFDCKWMKHHYDIDIESIFDTMIASQIINGARQYDDRGSFIRHGLGQVAKRFLGIEVDKEEQKSDWSGMLTTSQLEYAAKDAQVMLPLREAQRKQIFEDGLVECAALEFNAVLPIATLELNGIPIDQEMWLKNTENNKTNKKLVENQLQDQLQDGMEYFSLLGRQEINLSSEKQVIECLRNLGIPVEDSTKDEILAELGKTFPVCELIREFRGLDKAISSYGEDFLRWVHPITGRIHPDIFQCITDTGRFSVKNPAMQTIPALTEYRECFRPGIGKKIGIADYGQYELVAIAYMSQDERMISAINSGEDLHYFTASLMYNTPVSQVTKKQRQLAKLTNYAVAYGAGGKRIVDAAKKEGLYLTEQEGWDTINKWYSAYPGVKSWQDKKKKLALLKKELRSYSGRVMYVDYDPNDSWQKAQVERNACNFPAQAGNADATKKALRYIYDSLKGTSGKLIHCVHDEVVVECDDSEAEEVAVKVEKGMLDGAYYFIKGVKVKAEAKIMDCWAK